MNVFVLNSGRCGSTTFIQACRHIVNFSAGHETRINHIGPARLDYPDQHIEADNRLSWILGRLHHRFGTAAFYVHLQRDLDATAASFVKRREFGIMQAYREGILLGSRPEQSAIDQAVDYLDTIETNIALFLRDKPHQMSFRLENADAHFSAFWHRIGAEGDLPAALREWRHPYNASGATTGA